MQARIEGRDGWVEVIRDGLWVLAKGDRDLAVRVSAALDAAAGATAGPAEDLADVVTDELTTGGIRRTPDFAVVDARSRRVLVRGSALVRLRDADGTDRAVHAPARGPWSDEDIADGVDEAVLETGEHPAILPRVGANEADAPDEPSPQTSTAESAPAGGWAMPSVFGGTQGGGTAQPSGQAQARPDLTVVPDPEPHPEPTAGPGRVAERTEGSEGADTDDLPSFDFLFGNTSHHRSSLLASVQGDEDEDAPIDAGPVAAAGGFHPPQSPTDATLAPPSEDDVEEDHIPEPAEQPRRAPVGEVPSGLPPMPGGPARVQAARDDAPGREPGGHRPQFFDGHLVGTRVPLVDRDDDDAPSPDGGSPQPTSATAQPGAVISSVPWGGDDGSLATPEIDEPDDTGEIPSGPMVLAVRCTLGHHNPPHATRCRVCGQELPSQQPEQTPRPALGLLRLSTGDVVTLDRGVLIGRAPRAATDTGGAGAPHLVRVSSPDNEISRNHVEIVLDGWHVLVRDLGSTNGTTVALPGSSPVRVRPGDQQTIEPGTTITLADQVSMVFEVTG